MKYWQKENWQKATKQNIHNLYLYTWIRVAVWFGFCINSILMIFLSEIKNIMGDTISVRKVSYILLIGLGILNMSIVFDERKVMRTLLHVVIDCILVIIFSGFYCDCSLKSIPLYFIELIIICYFAIKIQKDNTIVDNCRVVKWWKQKNRGNWTKKLRR